MKARIKATGEIIDVFAYGDGWKETSKGTSARSFCYGDLEFIHEQITAEPCSTEPDWNQVRIQAAIAAMNGLITLNAENLRGNLDIPVTTLVAEYAVEYADALIAELQKPIK
jgi:hypothetical protein